MANCYYIELEDRGCPRCNHGKTWRIIKPDDSMHYTIFDNEEDAQEVCDIFTEGYKAGYQIGHPK